MMGEWTRASWTKRWRCWFRVHRWYYFGYKPRDWHRTCTLCGRREQASYDMSTGATLWWRFDA